MSIEGEFNQAPAWDNESKTNKQAFLISEEAGRVVDTLYARAVEGSITPPEIGMAAVALRRQVFEDILKMIEQLGRQ